MIEHKYFSFILFILIFISSPSCSEYTPDFNQIWMASSYVITIHSNDLLYYKVGDSQYNYLDKDSAKNVNDDWPSIFHQCHVSYDSENLLWTGLTNWNPVFFFNKDKLHIYKNMLSFIEINYKQIINDDLMFSIFIVTDDKVWLTGNNNFISYYDGNEWRELDLPTKEIKRWYPIDKNHIIFCDYSDFLFLYGEKDGKKEIYKSEDDIVTISYFMGDIYLVVGKFNNVIRVMETGTTPICSNAIGCRRYPDILIFDSINVYNVVHGRAEVKRYSKVDLFENCKYKNSIQCIKNDKVFGLSHDKGFNLKMKLLRKL